MAARRLSRTSEPLGSAPHHLEPLAMRHRTNRKMLGTPSFCRAKAALNEAFSASQTAIQCLGRRLALSWPADIVSLRFTSPFHAETWEFMATVASLGAKFGRFAHLKGLSPRLFASGLSQASGGCASRLKPVTYVRSHPKLGKTMIQSSSSMPFRAVFRIYIIVLIQS